MRPSIQNVGLHPDAIRYPLRFCKIRCSKANMVLVALRSRQSGSCQLAMSRERDFTVRFAVVDAGSRW